MSKSNDTLAREMAAFCKQRSKRSASRPVERPQIGRAVLGAVITALVAVPRKPCWR